MTGIFISRKVSAKKKDDGSLETRRRNGSENNGYIPEESWHPEQMPSESNMLMTMKLTQWNCFPIFQEMCIWTPCYLEKALVLSLIYRTF